MSSHLFLILNAIIVYNPQYPLITQYLFQWNILEIQTSYFTMNLLNYKEENKQILN